MVAPTPVPDSPVVTIIVPARNEEAILSGCLESLTSQTGVPFEIIVVDDDSSDRTREIAESFPQVRVVTAGPIPAGWTGKSNAAAAGAREARGQWILFTDADTKHRAGSLARAVAEAKAHGVDLLSYSAEQGVFGVWEKAIMPVIFAELATTYRPEQVNNPASPAAAANGQYILISRNAYEAVGGFGAVAGTLLEDVALARVVKASGRRIFFRLGDDAVRTRMYRSFAALKEGWTKNLVLLFPSPVRLAFLRFTEFLLIAGSAAVAIAARQRGNMRPAEIAAAFLSLLLFSIFMVRIRKAHFRWDATALSLIGLPLFSYLLIRSRIAHREGAVTWKGRTYSEGRVVESNNVSGTNAPSGPLSASNVEAQKPNFGALSGKTFPRKTG